MPMWGGYWGMPWGGFGWILPLIGLLFMVGMGLACFRMMGGCMTRHGGPTRTEVEGLHREVRDPKEEIRKLRERT
ncbi:MAG TPA: hypothetical protein VEH53_07010 [archaeon]|nr:hypothetical protein [archaeon]